MTNVQTHLTEVKQFANTPLGALTIAPQFPAPCIGERVEMPITETASESSNREKLLERLSTHFQIQITGIKKLLSEPPDYVLDTSNGSVHLGTVGNLIDQKPLRHHIAATCGKIIPTFPNNQSKTKKGSLPPWREIAQMSLDACEEVEVGPDGTDAGEIDTWLCDYINSVGSCSDIAVSVSVNRALRKVPVINEDQVLIFLGAFRQWVNHQNDFLMSNRKMAIRLRRYGAVRKSMPFIWDDDEGEKRCSASVWILPKPASHYEAEC
jgi:hypothetical protein